MIYTVCSHHDKTQLTVTTGRAIDAYNIGHSTFLTLWLPQGDRGAGLRGVTDAVLIDGAHSEAVLLALGQVKHWEPGRVYLHVQTGQLPAALPCQGLIPTPPKKQTKTTSKHRLHRTQGHVHYSVSFRLPGGFNLL